MWWKLASKYSCLAPPNTLYRQDTITFEMHTAYSTCYISACVYLFFFKDLGNGLQAHCI